MAIWYIKHVDSPLTDAPYLLRSLLLLKRQSVHVMYVVYRQTIEATTESACTTLDTNSNYLRLKTHQQGNQAARAVL